MQARRLVRQRGLVDVGGANRVGDDADLRQQRQPARAGGGQVSERDRVGQPYLNRKVMRPLLRS